jgi:hypothetical protein
MYCTTCDFQLPNDTTVVFCPNCGARIAKSLGSPSSSPGGFTLPPASVAVSPPSYGTSTQPTYTPTVSGIPQGSLPPASYPPVAVNSNTAIISLVFGILSWVMLPFVGAIVAIVAGHMARREIAAAGGQMSGAGMAMAGLILGYIHMAFVVIGGCLLLILVGFAALSLG